MAFSMPGEAALSGLTLRVRDRARAIGFYRDLLGLSVSEADGATTLAPARQGFALRLEVAPDAPPRPPRSLGLYHFAFLLPTRRALGAVLRRLLEAGWPVDGASDHIVSEAIYLRDAEGNGIELAHDRPRKQWRYARGQVAMVTDMLDVRGLLAGAPAAAGLDPATRLGHVHLSVGDLARGEAFYAGLLGLSVTQRTYPGALFLAAGDYHHHVGINIWGARRPAPAGAPGLVGFTWRVPPGTVETLTDHLDAAGTGAAAGGAAGALTLSDPVGTDVTIADASRA